MRKNIIKKSISIMIIIMVCLGSFSTAFAGSSSTPGRKVTLALTGDLMCESRYQDYKYDPETDSYDFEASFTYVKEYISNADLAVGNLETPVSVSSPLAKEIKRYKDKPYMNAPEGFLDVLKSTGFDGLILANNHMCDTGKKGIRDTVDILNEKGFKHTGAYKSSKDKRYFILRKNGIKIGFVAYATYYNERDRELSKADRKNMLARYNYLRAKRDIKAAKKAGADFIVAYIHMGNENTYKITDLQKKRMAGLAKAGADFIVGSHPHVLQRTGYVKIKGKKVHFVYSMGNFTGKCTRSMTRETALLRLTIRKNTKGHTYLSNREYIPCFMKEEYKGRKMVLLPEGCVKKEGSLKTELDEHYRHIREILRIK